MITVLIICAVCCACMLVFAIAKPKLKFKRFHISSYWIITVLGALALLIFGFIGFGEVFDGLTANSAVNPLKILILFIAITILALFLDETGFFSYIANFVLKKTGSNQIKLFTTFFITVCLLTIFTSNDIIILTTPFVCYFAKNAKVNPLPYLVSQFVAANTCSMLLIIGNPTNIYLAASNGIDFIEYFTIMAIPTLFAIITAYFIMLLLFYKKLKAPITGSAGEVKIKQKALLVIGLILLLSCTVLLAISAYINIEMWLIAFAMACSLIVTVLTISLIKKNPPKELGRTLLRAPWELIPFIISMFVMVLALGKYDVTTKIANLLGDGNPILTYGAASVIFANLINNIPMSVLFSAILADFGSTGALYAVIIGSNISAFLTPIGSLAGIMWMSILKKNDVNYSFARFLGYGIIIAIPVLLAALGGLALVLT